MSLATALPQDSFASLSNYTDGETEHMPSSYVRPFTDAWVIACTCILAVFLMFGLFANSVTIAVIATSSRLNNQYYTFIMSMCTSDIVSAFVSILFLYRRTWGFDYFAWPEIFCRLYWGLDLWTSFVTALHILSFAVLRLIGVQWPTKFQRITSAYMKAWIVSLWTVAFFGGFIPHFLFNTVKVIDRNDSAQARWASCSLSTYWFSTWQVYVQIAYAFFLYLPALAIIAISITIAVVLRKRRVLPGEKPVSKSFSVTVLDANSSQAMDSSQSSPKVKPKVRESAAQRRWRKDKQAIYQLFLIVGSFFLGYIPLTAFHFYTGFTIDMSNNEINAFDWRFAMVQYMMLRFSECLNPIFYNLASNKMRNETKIMLKKMFRISSKRNCKDQPNACRISSGV